MVASCSPSTYPIAALRKGASIALNLLYREMGAGEGEEAEEEKYRGEGDCDMFDSYLYFFCTWDVLDMSKSSLQEIFMREVKA